MSPRHSRTVCREKNLNPFHFVNIDFIISTITDKPLFLILQQLVLQLRNVMSQVDTRILPEFLARLHPRPQEDGVLCSINKSGMNSALSTLKGRRYETLAQR